MERENLLMQAVARGNWFGHSIESTLKTESIMAVFSRRGDLCC